MSHEELSYDNLDVMLISSCRIELKRERDTVPTLEAKTE